MNHIKRRMMGVLLSFSMMLCIFESYTVIGYATGMVQPTVGVGGSFMVALNADGDAFAWGDNAAGALGNGTVNNASTAVRVSMPTDRHFREIAVGFDHVLAIADNGAVYAWGSNAYGQCGREESANVLVPTAIAFSDSVNIVSVATGKHFSLALSDGGDVYAWGRNNFLQLGQESGAESAPIRTPKQIPFPDAVTVTGIFAGYSSASALTDDGDVYLWGANQSYQLATDESKTDLAPTKLVSRSVSSDIRAVSHGNVHTSFLKTDGSVLSCGKNVYGQFGNETSSDEASAILKKASVTDVCFSAICAGDAQTVALSVEGDIYVAGQQLVGADSSDQFRLLAVQSTSKAVHIAAGYGNAAALLQDGTVIAWGANASGQLGNGALTDSTTPVAVMHGNDLLQLGTASGNGSVSNSSGQSTTVSATVNVPSPTYAITIPANIDLGNLTKTGEQDPERIKRVSFTVAASGIANLPENQALTVTVTPPEGVFALTNEEGVTLSYEIYPSAQDTDAIAVGGMIAQFTEDGERSPQIRVDQSKITESGQYEGVLNFAFSIGDVSE